MDGILTEGRQVEPRRSLWVDNVSVTALRRYRSVHALPALYMGTEITIRILLQ